MQFVTYIQLAISVSQDLMVAVLKIAIEQLSSFLDAYKSAFQVGGSQTDNTYVNKLLHL